MASRPKVFVIVLNWDGMVDTLACLSSLRKCNYDNKEVVVVDNGSSDHSAEIIQARFPEVHIIHNMTNEGFCKGNNIGIRYALDNKAEYVWLLNNDTEVESSTLSKLVENAEESTEIGLVSPVLCYFEDKTKVQFSGSYIDLKTFEIHYPECKESPDAIFQTGPNVILWGTALLIKRTVIENIGLLDERFFAYWEDTDYSIRSIKGGFRNVVCKDARIYHKRPITPEGEVPKKSSFYYYFYERNRILLQRKHAKSRVERARILAMGLANGSAHVPLCPKEYVEIALTGVWHGIKGISGTFKTKPEMPWILRTLLIKISKIHPVFIVNILTFDLNAAYRAFLRFYSGQRKHDNFSL